MPHRPVCLCRMHCCTCCPWQAGMHALSAPTLTLMLMRPADDDEEEGMYGWAAPGSGGAGAYGWPAESGRPAAAQATGSAQASQQAHSAAPGLGGGGGRGGHMWGPPPIASGPGPGSTSATAVPKHGGGAGEAFSLFGDDPLSPTASVGGGAGRGVALVDAQAPAPAGGAAGGGTMAAQGSDPLLGMLLDVDTSAGTGTASHKA